jgi:hypothetical protein
MNLARLGSLNGSLATLDLSSASDSISYELVSLLMPPCWFTILDEVRSPIVDIDGEEHKCEMFSSMGNGFTFELESLLFYALAKATAYFTRTRGKISVYGDDIIVPVQMAEHLTQVLDYFGFSLNPEKSFWSGPFRESCGGHYHLGEDITPFFIRKPIKTLVDLIHLLNAVRLWCSRGEALFLSEDGWLLWDLLSELVPRMFWGGDVLSSGRGQLVSPHHPCKRLVGITKHDSLPEVGSYLNTMFALSKRSESSLIESNSFEPSVASIFFRVKHARRWTWHDSGLMFLTELSR